MSHRITCRNCDEEFTPTLGKPGYYDVCARCTERELAENPGLEPEPLRAGPSIDESGTFDEIAPASHVKTYAHLGNALADTMAQKEDRVSNARIGGRRK
jgi:hypothetical protein